MASLSLLTLRNLTRTYLGTSSVDPLYPDAVLNVLINAVAQKFATDIQEARPDYMATLTTLVSVPTASNTYPLPADFNGWLEVRITDYTGIQLGVCRLEELNQPGLIYAFAITGADQNSTLYTCPQMLPGTPLYFRYQQLPPDLVNDTDVPTWMPSRFHDLLARQTAIDAYGIGNEDTPADLFVLETSDRLAQMYLEVSRRGVAPYTTRSVSAP